MLKNWFEKFDSLLLVVLLVGVLLVFVGILKVLAPIFPILQIVGILFLTCLAWEGKLNPVLIVTGFILYGGSWFTVGWYQGMWGQFFPSLIALTGIILWLNAIIRSFEKNILHPLTVIKI